MKYIAVSLSLMCIAINIYSQNIAKHNQPINIKKIASVSVNSIVHDWDPSVQYLEMPATGSEEDVSYLIQLKEKLYGDKKYIQQEQQKTATDILPVPSITAGFEGNPMGSGVPNDNDMAISNAGKIISVINSSIYIYDEFGTQLYAVSLAAFCDTLGIIYSKYDPRVLYDPEHDKFVLVFLSGYTPETTNIIIAFSKTNDPLGEWNFYALPGNPKDNDRWTDYPMIAITHNELFITGNLIIPDEPWQTGFSETLVWQMNLNNGYIGVDINAAYYDNIYFGDKPIRNICPAKGGSAPHGPDMYFLSNRNFAETNDTIFIMHITGELSDPETQLETTYALSDINYGVPPQARQFGGHIFDTNDGRILEAYFENNTIQLVSNSIDPATGFCGIYHAVISDLETDKHITAHIIGDDTLDFGYPDISYSGHWDGDDQSIISFDHTAPTVYAGMSVVYFNYGAYSDVISIKTGDTYVNVLAGTYERWGDYSGSQRKYDTPGEVWVSGNFGKMISNPPITYRNNATWIAALYSNDNPGVSIYTPTSKEALHIYPNPTAEYFITTLTMAHDGEISFKLFDMQGKLIKYLLNTEVFTGKNSFSFSMQPLAAGNYILQVTTDDTTYTEKITKQ